MRKNAPFGAIMSAFRLVSTQPPGLQLKRKHQHFNSHSTAPNAPISVPVLCLQSMLVMLKL
eukprot:6173439-Pleurochrysis_carterae.AAC.3